MLETLGPNRLTPLKGLLAGLLYDPYPPRFLHKIQELIAGGIPLLGRFHPGLCYPMDDADLHQTVDREGHVIAIVGFDDTTQTLLIADPWDKARFGGERGGVYNMYAPLVTGIMLVDATLDITSCAWPLPIKLTVSPLGPKESKVVAEVAFTGPRGISLVAQILQGVMVSIQLPRGLVLISNRHRQFQDMLLPQEVVRFCWQLVETAPVDGEIRVAAAAIAKGSDPYAFQDVVGSVASVLVQSLDVEPVGDEQGIGRYIGVRRVRETAVKTGSLFSAGEN